jgi:hypothetical protein
VKIYLPFQISFVLSSAPAVARELLLTRQAAILATQAAESVLSLAAYEDSKSSFPPVFVLTLEHIFFKLELKLVDQFLQMTIAPVQWVDLHQRGDDGRSLSTIVHVKNAVLPNKMPSVDGVLCRNDNVAVDCVKYVTPTFGDIGTGGIRLITITPWPDNSKLVLTDDFLHFDIILEKVSGLCMSWVSFKWERVGEGDG